ncbi:MAG TPA: DsbE family thiol:disulfide interchange protein [Candidatus Competibacteraceae bacterium]|nr:DsbE family thiol:disulfide interchange protein [Candidatus Competibacteraceae bacterium]
MSRGLKLTLLLALPLAGFLALLGLLWQGLGRDPSLLPSALIDRPLPAFRLAALGEPGRFISQDDLKGKPALLNVWATWCPTCRAEHEMLRSLAAQGVTIYGVNYKDDPTKAVQWLKDLGNPYTLNIDDQSGQLGIDLGVYGAPETFILDARGVIRYRHVGAVDEQVWREVLEPRLKLLQGGQG